MGSLQMMKQPSARWLLTLATLVGSGVALHYALRDLHWSELRTLVAGLDWRWIALAVLFDVASYVLQGFRWRRLLDGATTWQTTRAIYAGLFVNEVVPMRPGEALRAWVAARDLGTGMATVIPTIVAERLLDVIVLSAAVLIVSPVSPLLARFAGTTTIVAVAVAVVVTIAVLIWRIGKRKVRLPDRVVKGLRNPMAFIASAGFLVTQALAFWCVMRATHLSLSLVAAFVVMLSVRVGTLIPGAPANVGTHQLSTTLALTSYGISHAAAAGFSIVVFSVLTIPLCTLGFAALLSTGVCWPDLFVGRRNEFVLNTAD
jgi:glycosyltransferase 2 family protein